MAGTKSKARASDQRSIKTFFKKPSNKSGEPSSDVENDAPATDNVSSDVDDASDDEQLVDAKNKQGKSSKKPGKAVDPAMTNLPPIHEIPKIFDDLVSHIPKIKEVAEQIAGRNLRVATMCSGTESPLLALELIQKSVFEQHGIKLGVEHVFSCEIEPFKQAYIERNFHPPLLFRDVCELGDREAHTAYGALAPVPGDVDILIAGTSCVDYSNLNNEKQDIEANGESGRTFRGMMSWVTNHRPPIVILENVCSAPWKTVKQKFEKNGYSAEFCRVDTKFYYIPHTRTRVYLFAVDQRRSDIPSEWLGMVQKDLKRPSSSTLDAFLLSSDDPRIHQARQKLVQESFNALDRKTGRTDWTRCESRHQRARLEEGLGAKRPLTAWEDGGFCRLQEGAWNDWGVGQVERVWDLMDISLLRDAKKGVDPSHKTTVWNLSQNVDRTIGSNKWGICPCLTPSMIPYITNRGGPMVGLEALAMQGLPVDKLLLTRETEDQLADLAGNAMSTTVVGACILAALVSAKGLLKAGDDKETYETKTGTAVEEIENDAMDVDEVRVDTLPIEDRILGEDLLVYQPLDLTATMASSFTELLDNAQKSARLCSCEGRTDITNQPIMRCLDCGNSACTRCGGRPEHNPKLIDVVAHPRLHPADFAKQLKSILPMCMILSNVTTDILDRLKDSSGLDIPSLRWGKWSETVIRASTSILRFTDLKRQEVWTAVYRSPDAILELLLHPQQPEWRLYAIAEEQEPANGEIRRLLESPIGRLVCAGDLLSGKWEFALPHSITVPVTIKGVGELVPSWQSLLGLTDDEFKNKTVYSKLEVSVPDSDVPKFDRDISGTYTLFEKCGTANSALHKRVIKDETLPPIFLFFDPMRTSEESSDCFVFSSSIRRYEFGESRLRYGKLAPSWRQSNSKEEVVNCTLPVHWITSEDVTLEPSQGQEATFGTPDKNLVISASNEACGRATALLVCKVTLRGHAGPEWPRHGWQEVDKIHERGTFKALAWLLERVQTVGARFDDWQLADMPDDTCNCERCAPTPPAIQWVRTSKKIVPVEDPVQAGQYERSLKSRPNAFITQLKLETGNKGTVRVGINIPSLLHRALSRLPSVNRDEAPILSWRLNTSFVPLAALNLDSFVIKSNKEDKEHAQPPSFKLPLRKEQLRSLEWMVEQESEKCVPFMEEEISEAMLDPLGWRAEGRAERPVHVRGGVLADQVGYGKTAITLGLIDCTARSVEKEVKKLPHIYGKIAVKATLIIVPSHLTRQWATEVKKFTDKRFNVLVLSSASNLNSATIEAIQEADIVVVAATLFKSVAYLENLQLLAGCGELPSKEGRHFNAQLERSLEALKTQTERLQNDGASAVLKEVKEAQKRVEQEAEAMRVQTKRLKGKSYRDAADQLAAEKAEAEKPVRAKPTPSGLIPEVVINRSASSSGRASTAASSGPETLDDSESVEDRPRRSAARKSIVLSDDEDESEVEPVKKASKKKKAAPKGRSKAKKSKSDDDDGDDFIAESSEDEDVSSAEASSSDEEAAATAKPKPKAKSKAKLTSASEDSDNQSMDVDEPAKAPAKKGTKRKADDDGGSAAKKSKRTDNDPWKLGSRAVQSNWELMHAPPLEMFHFARTVVDEYTYLDGKIHSLITKLTAGRRWVLSGTPPIHDFGALKTISAFLDIHLGIDDDAEGKSAEVKKRRRDQTGAEKFHSFREVHSLDWHAHRHALGQKFLDRFVRQNIAEIDEIPWSSKTLDIILPAAERAIYLELEHHLRALDMTIKRGKKTESDREKRLNISLGDSKTAEEALLKRCSHFDLDTSSNENAMKACDVIVKERQKQLDECKAELLKGIKAGLKTEKALGNVGNQSMFHEWILVSRAGEIEDEEASQMVIDLIDQAGVGVVVKKSKNQDITLSEKVKADVWAHREKTHELRRLTKELVGRVRSLRYFTVVRDLQKQTDAPPVVTCPSSGCNKQQQKLDITDIAVLSSCGHMGCLDCVRRCAEREECVYAESGACKSAARVLNIVKADTLGVDDVERDGRGKHFGMKLEKVVDLIKKDIPKKERVLVFVQFPDLMKKVTEALKYNNIGFLEIRGTATQKSKNLEMFQNGSDERVLLLNVMDESASGANLTSANHAIFLSPLLAATKEIYKACETQAIGRLVRYGQEKHVHVWRLHTKDTIDEEIFEKRRDVSMISE
ncbi:hypothetical protein C8J56DRAFT_870233 [Mycena floridula]|nr:hypothetical protein C8J56DRAFT_870233 [Mycena floridula]